jgi:septal ring factor EnvC (AmiA/AmiB activator)
MTTETTQPTVTPTPYLPPITLEDVRAAVGETDPNNTNADRIRMILGRGSNATIQKHLNTLRAELVPAPLNPVVETPAPPKELIAGLWSHAWQTAQAQAAAAVAAAIIRREQAERERDVAAADRDAAQAGQDTAAEMLEKERASREERINELLHDIDEVIEERNELKKELEKAEAKLNEVKKEAALQQERAAAAAALAAAQHTAVIESMRAEVDRLVNQLADLRSAFKTRVQPSTNENKDGEVENEEK